MRLAEAVTELRQSFDNHSHPEMEANIEELATALLGPMRSQLAGNGRDEEQGLIWKVNEGQLKLALPTWTKWAAFGLIVVNIGSGIKSILS